MVSKFELFCTPVQENRMIHLYLPNDYDQSTEEYAVLYVMDGHNLYYDEDATFGKSLGMKDFLDGWWKSMMVVGIQSSTEKQRVEEYSPFDIKSPIYGEVKGTGQQTMEWIVNELKPYIDSHYRTNPSREATAIAGNGNGGTMAFYGVLRYNQIFSKAAVISPTIKPAAMRFKELIQQSELAKDTRIFFSWGTDEGETVEEVEILTHTVVYLEKTVLAKGVRTFLSCQPEGIHNELSWQHLVSTWMQFLWVKN